MSTRLYANREMALVYLVPLAAFAAVTAIAEAAGAVNLGTAMGIGQLAFAASVVAVLLRA